MNEVLYEKAERDLVADMQGTRPQRVLGDGFYQTVFDYGDYHIRARPESLSAATQNKEDEAIQVRFERVEESYEAVSADSDVLEDNVLLEDRLIVRVWLLRTVLYFTDFRAFDSPEEALEGTDIAGDSETDDKLREMIAQSIGGYEEVVCHPDSEEAARQPADHANLVDTGALFFFGEQALAVHSPNNGFSSCQELYEPSEVLESVALSYKLVGVGDAT